jgi:polyisoprenoid-binding protein YceI
MKTLILSVFSLFATFAFASTEPTSGGEVDVTSSTIEWVGKKVTGKHTGTIALKSGKLMMENGEIKGGMFEIDMTSITVTDLTGNMKAKLEGHLNSDDFFSTATYPVATIEITNAKKTEANTYKVMADATIKGITKPVEFTATVKDNMAMADIVVDRTQFDVKYGSGSFFDGLGDKMIYDDFTLAVMLVMK